MSPSSVSCFPFFCVLVLLFPAQHGASSYASYNQGSRLVFFKTPGKSSGNSQQASTVPPATTCSPITTGPGNNKLPVVHRQSPCSPLHGQQSPTTDDVLRRDSSIIRRSFSSESPVVDAQAPSPPAGIVIPTNSSSDRAAPSALNYRVVVGFGTPEQLVSVFLDNTFGTTSLRCKPCASGFPDCDPAFDTLESSTFARVLCGSPDCPTNCSDGSVCPFNGVNGVGKGTFVEDVIALAPSVAVHNFRFACMDNDVDDPSLDLSRGPNSLPSQLAPGTTFSYCLPQSPSSQGFLALGGKAAVGNDDNNLTSHAPLVTSSNPELSSMYFIDVIGMTLDGEDLPIPAGTFGGSNGNARTTLHLLATITRLAPDAYAVLRDAFLKWMSQYNRSVPGFAGFDTCFNFTGMDELIVPAVQFKFSNGESLGIGDPMLYYDDPTVGPFGLTCLAFSSLDAGVADVFSAVIGTYSLTSTEVIYDLAGGMVGFVPNSC